MSRCIRIIAYIDDKSRLDELKRILAEQLSKNFGCKFGVYLCVKGLDKARVLYELNEILANNSTNTIILFEFDDWGDAVRYAEEFGSGCVDIQLSPAHH